MAKAGEFPGLDQPFTVPLRTVQDIIARRLRQQYRGEGGRSGSRIASMVEQLIEIADDEIIKIKKKGSLGDPKEFRELVRAVMDLRELQAQTFRREADGRGATTPSDQKGKAEAPSPLVRRGVAAMRREQRAGDDKHPSSPAPAPTSP